jgi:hypothetical protein
MSGKIIGTIVGAAAAYFTGGIALVGFGAAIGGALGSLLDPKEIIEGPRLEDLKVQVSTYGIGVPRLYGTERLGGNVIWSTDKLEIATDTEAGKGGGPINRSYKYYVHMTLLLCETPRDGSTVSILKFFQDGKLIWDVSSGISIESALASAENPYSAFVLFQGHNDQLPDPIEESWTGGPGTCSAYRGVVRIRMIAIECPGGRVPQFSFVCSTSNLASAPILPIATVPMSFVQGGICTTEGAYHWTYSTSSGIPLMSVYAVGSGYATPLFQSAYQSGLFGAYAPRPVNGSKYEALRAYILSSDVSTICLEIVDLVTGKVTRWADLPKASFNGLDRFGGTAYDPVSDKYAITSSNASSETIFVGSAAGMQPTIVGASAYLSALAFYSGVIYALYCTSAVNGSMSFVAYDAVTGSTIYTIAAPAGVNWSTRAAVVQADANGIYIFINPYGVLTDSGCVYKLSGTGTWSQLCSTVKVFASDGSSVSPSCSISTTGIVAGPYLDATYDLTLFAALDPIPVKVSSIITAECKLAGDGVYDVTGIPDSDTVIGYKIAGPASARANVEPLLTLTGGYVVDEDAATKFKKFADITSVATVTFDELGQAEGDASGEAMPLNRTQEIDLQRSVTTTYIEPTNDYQTAAETEVRQVTDATEDVQIQLAICVTSDQAKKVSQMSLYDRWRRQNTRSTSVSRKFAAVSPGDGVTIEYPRGTFKLWLVLSTNDTGAVCEWSLCPGDAAIFTQTAIGATGYVSQEVAPLAAPTQAQILDMPIMRDEDNNAGLYVALDSYGATPADAELLVGDDDTNLQSRGTVSASAPIGFTETSLPAAVSGVVDETNLLTVNLGDDVFASCTRDVLLSGGGEYWAYGAPGRWEIGASAVGNSLGSGRYTLSRHLRGLFGTERYTGTHAVGDTFVLLRIVGMLRPSMSAGEIGQIKQYRAVTKGRSPDSATSQAYANTGEGLVPLSPINLRRTDANDFTVDRRSRLAMNNSTGTLPLGEAAEAWSWEFYTSGAYTTRVGVVLTTTATVTAAQQTAIGVTPSATAFVKVRQISDTAGAGHELQATA